MQIIEILNILVSIPKTIAFNFRYLPFSQAIKLPIWVASNCKICYNFHTIYRAFWHRCLNFATKYRFRPIKLIPVYLAVVVVLPLSSQDKSELSQYWSVPVDLLISPYLCRLYKK